MRDMLFNNHIISILPLYMFLKNAVVRRRFQSQEKQTAYRNKEK